MLLLAGVRAGAFPLDPEGWKYGDTMTNERELIEEASQETDEVKRVRRLYFHLIGHRSPDAPLHSLVAERLFDNGKNESVFLAQLRAMAEFATKGQNEEYRARKARREPDERIVRVQYPSWNPTVASEPYQECSATLAGMFSVLAQTNQPGAVRVLGAMLFYEGREWSESDYGVPSVATSAMMPFSRLIGDSRPEWDIARERRDPNYKYVRVLQDWWIQNAGKYGAVPPPPELVEASRRLHEDEKMPHSLGSDRPKGSAEEMRAGGVLWWVWAVGVACAILGLSAGYYAYRLQVASRLKGKPPGKGVR